MRRRIRNASVSLLVLLQLTLATGASGGLMLCVEADGRSAIETVFAADCCVPQHAQPHVDVTADQLACDCVDVPLLFSAAAIAVGSRQVAAPLLALALLRTPALSVAPVRIETRRAAVSHSAPTSDLFARRSVVLLV